MTDQHGWQPIETAPRDGTPVFVTAPYWWEGGKMKGGVPVCVVWCVPSDRFPGVWANPNLYGVHSELTVRARHWMPLPPPPGDAA